MGRFIRALPPWGEFAIVVLAAFGYPIVTSVFWAFFASDPPSQTARHLAYLVAYELVVLLFLAMFLRIRGWTVERLGATMPNLEDALVGVGLGLIAYIAYVALLLVAAIAVPETITAARTAARNATLVTGGLRLMDVAVISIVNPIFEEVFVCGYVVTALGTRRGPWKAVNVSAAIRLLYHLYQGPVSVLSIGPIGLLFAWWYARNGRLWPLVVAHALFDFDALARYVGV